MADYNSELPVRSQLPGQVNPDDIIVKLGDATNPTTQQAKVDANGRQYSVLSDVSGNNVTTEANGAQRALDVMTQNSGSATGGTAANFSGLAGGVYNTTPPTLTNGQQAALQLDSSGRLLVDAIITFPYDTNYGTVDATTLRTAAQIGNATGAANFNYGTVGAQTLRVAAQIGNATGAADFGAGATDAQTLRVASNLYDGSGNAITSTGGALNVSATQSGTWTVQQGSAPWSFVGNLTNNNAAPAATNVGALVAIAESTINASRYTSGDQVLLVTDLAGNTNMDLQYYLGAAVSVTNPIMTTISDGTHSITAAISAYGTAPTGTEVMGVNAYITNTPTVNQGTSPWIVKDLADGSVTGGTAGTFSLLTGGIYNSTPPTLTNGQQASLQLDSAGRLLVDAAVTFPYDTNYGTVGATTLRTAAEIGNATGAANFNYGTVGAQTLRTASQIGNATGAADFGAGAATAQTLRVTDSNFPTTVDTNYGTVGASTIRTASQIGNATGAADFGAGATDAQTLRVTANQGTPNTAANAWPISITSGGAANSATNPVFVTVSDVVGTPINIYTDSASVAAKASVNVDYTVSAGKTFYTDQIWATASGLMKIQVEYETAAGSGTFNTFWVGFNSTATPNILIPVPNEKTQVTGARIRLVVQNLDQAAMDLYTTLSGTEQ
jgi:hypothetical protein